jgi:hypothetical protein
LAALVRSGSPSKASSSMSRLTVNPIPARIPTARTSAHRSELDSEARVNRATVQAPPKTPSGLPTTRPRITASATGCVIASPPRPTKVTPAEKNANSGTQTPADSGRMACS